MTKKIQAEIFCRVIDNFGDAGVCWRLAKRLRDLGVEAFLCIDNLKTLGAFLLKELPDDAESNVDGIVIRPWDLVENAAYCVKDLTIETFGCRIPECVEDALAASPERSFYVNLDYLSAEDWVEDCHGVWGLHPNKPIKKLWFFPGFTDATGGVLIEDGFTAKRDEARSRRASFLAEHGLVPERRTFFLFTYPSAPLEALAAALNELSEDWNVALAQGAASEKIAGMIDSRHSTVILPFVSQEEFDAVLSCADSSIVRGEDSFVRAQLSARPFIWSPYVTEDKAHEVKLGAWLEKFSEFSGGCPESERIAAISRAWVEGRPHPNDLCRWIESDSFNPAFQKLFEHWADSLVERGDLAEHILSAAGLNP